MRFPRLTEVFRFLDEARCTKCGSDGAYQGFNKVECPNPKCQNYDPRQAGGDPNVFSKDDIEVISFAVNEWDDYIHEDVLKVLMGPKVKVGARVREAVPSGDVFDVTDSLARPGPCADPDAGPDVPSEHCWGDLLPKVKTLIDKIRKAK